MGKFFWLTFIVVASVSGALVWHFAPTLGERLPPEVRRQICRAVDATLAQFTRLAQFTGKDHPSGAAARQDDAGAQPRVRPVDLAEPDAAWGVLNCITPVEELDGKPIGNVAGGKIFLIKETISTPDGLKVTGTFDSTNLTRTVRIPAKNLSSFSGQPTDLSDDQRTSLSMYYQLTGEAEARKAKVKLKALEKNPYLQNLNKAVEQLRAREAAAKKLNTTDLDAQRKMTYEISQLRTQVHEISQKHKDWVVQHAAELPDPEKDPAYLEILRKRDACVEPIKDLLQP